MSTVNNRKKSLRVFALIVSVVVTLFLTACDAGPSEWVNTDSTEVAGETSAQNDTSPEAGSLEKETETGVVYTVNGFNLSEFTIVASAEAMEAAEVLKHKYNQSLSVENVSSFTGGNAIYVGTREINSYGGYKYYLGCEEVNGIYSIYIDGQAKSLSAVVDNIVQKYMKKSSGEAFQLPEDAYEYCWLDGEFSSGYAMKEVTERSLEKV